MATSANSGVTIDMIELSPAPKRITNILPFMQKHKDIVMAKQRLQNCDLIVDGSNMIAELAAGTSWLHGGDSDLYVGRIYTITDALRKANVSPIFFFNGPSTDDKVLRSRNNTAAHLHYIRALNNGCTAGDIHVSYVKHGYREQLIFRDILQLLQLPIIQVVSPQGYLHEMVAYARFRKAPLTSSNNNLYFYDLSGSCLITMPNFLQDGCMVRRDNDGTYIELWSYCRDRLASYFECTPRQSLFSLALAMLRNQDDIFKGFYGSQSTMSVDNHKKGERVYRTFYFLRSCPTIEEAKDRLYSSVPSDLWDQMHEEIDAASKCSNVSAMNVLWRFDSSTPCLSVHGQTLPPWIVRDFIDGKLLNFILLVLTLQTNTFWPHVEDLSQPSADLCSTQLRQYIYGILLACNPNRDTIVVTETLRCGDANIVPIQVRPLWQISTHGGPVPAMNDIDTLSRLERQRTFLTMLNVHDDDVEQVPPKKLFSYLALRYWFQNVSDVGRTHVLALLLSVAAVDTSAAIGEMASSLFGAEVVLYTDLINKIQQNAYYEHKSVDVRRMHIFSELQAILRDVKFLHRLLRQPCGPSSEIEDLDRFIKSSFIHEVMPDLTESSDLSASRVVTRLVRDGRDLLFQMLDLITRDKAI